jgi:hypothetical protein
MNEDPNLNSEGCCTTLRWLAWQSDLGAWHRNPACSKGVQPARTKRDARSEPLRWETVAGQGIGKKDLTDLEFALDLSGGCS